MSVESMIILLYLLESKKRLLYDHDTWQWDKTTNTETTTAIFKQSHTSSHQPVSACTNYILKYPRVLLVFMQSDLWVLKKILLLLEMSSVLNILWKFGFRYRLSSFFKSAGIYSITYLPKTIQFFSNSQQTYILQETPLPPRFNRSQSFRSTYSSSYNFSISRSLNRAFKSAQC